MKLKRSGSQPSAKGPAKYFTGNVRVDPLFQAPDPSRISASLVTFEPEARTPPLQANSNPNMREGWRV